MCCSMTGWSREAILERARREAKRIFVGKEVGDHAAAGAHQRAAGGARPPRARVARLKGGDPFIFGRGGEEIEAARRARHSLHRGAGHHRGPRRRGRRRRFRSPIAAWRTASPSSPGMWSRTTSSTGAHFAAARHTVVFYMGMAQLPAIVARLRAAGAPPSARGASSSGRRCPRSAWCVAHWQTSPSGSARDRLAAPALLFVGEVAAFARAPTARAASAQPACGRRLA